MELKKKDGTEATFVSRPLPWWVYMDEGMFRIRIGLPPRIVSGDRLASSSRSTPPLLFARAYPMSDDPGLY